MLNGFEMELFIYAILYIKNKKILKKYLHFFSKRYIIHHVESE